MADESDYVPPRVWVQEEDGTAPFAATNRAMSGATHDKALPVGRHPLQLYSQATANGVKVTILLEELLAAGHEGADYDAWLIRINDGEQFGSGFVAANPNSKIPVLVDHGEATPCRVFESGAILLYLAEKFGAFLPDDRTGRTETLNWLFWQMASTPDVGGAGFGHFYAYAPIKIRYCIDRYAMETKRLFDVLDQQLGRTQFVAGADYSIADMAIWPWFGVIATENLFRAGEFLDVESYANVRRWALEIGARPAVRRGRMVNRPWGPEEGQLLERHDASDFDLRTQDKVAASA